MFEGTYEMDEVCRPYAQTFQEDSDYSSWRARLDGKTYYTEVIYMNQVNYACTIPEIFKNETDTMFSGYMDIKDAGNYTIVVTYKGSFTVQINGVRIYNETVDDWDKIRTKEIVVPLEVSYHFIQVNYQSRGNMRFQVGYKGPNIKQ